MVRKCNYILRDVEDAIPYGLNHETFFFAGCLHLASSAGCRGRHPLRFKPRDLLLQYVCTSQARRDVEDAIPYGLNHEAFSSQDVCTSQARRDVEDAIPYGLNREVFSSQDVRTSFSYCYKHIYKTDL